MRKLHKKPIQVYLEPEHERALRRLATERGLSMGEIIRRCLDRYLTAEMPLEDDPALRIVGLGESTRGDLAENHDRYLAAGERDVQNDAG